jgi:hypothetical protein
MLWRRSAKTRRRTSGVEGAVARDAVDDEGVVDRGLDGGGAGGEGGAVLAGAQAGGGGDGDQRDADRLDLAVERQRQGGGALGQPLAGERRASRAWSASTDRRR